MGAIKPFRTTTIATKRTVERRRDKSAMLLSVILRALRNEVTPAKLAKLYTALKPRDQAMFIINFVKPPPPEKPKDIFDDLSPQQLDYVAQVIKQQANERKPNITVIHAADKEI
jgi:hypothetical protein